MTTNQCSICLNLADFINTVHDTDENGVKWSMKLQYVVPEVEWDGNYLICGNCIHELRVSCTFRGHCLNILKNVKSETTNENCPSSNLKFEEECESDAPMESGFDNTDVTDEDEHKVFTCFQCNESFNKKVDLIEHIETVHNSPTLKYKRTEKCLNCGRKFAKNASLKEHIEICDGVSRHARMGEKEHQCDKCKRFYSTKKILRQHKKRCIKKNVETNYQCTKCKTFYKHLSSLQKHQKLSCQKDDVPLFFCEVCDESFQSSSTLDKHLIEEHKNHIFYCRICGESFNSSQEYTNHKKSKHKQEILGKGRTFTCDICNSQFKFVRAIIEHYGTVHSVEEKLVKPYSCEICSKRFRTSTNLNNHKLYHGNNRTNICSICGNSFITKGDLMRHETLHYDDRNHKCDKCEKTFKTMDNLRTHCLIVHTDPMMWKFVCHVCGKRFPQRSNYEQHLRRHLGEKKFVCALCNKAFVTNKELQKHMDHHSNDRQYRCDQCGKEFRQKNSLNIHLTRTHGIGNAKIPIKERKHPCHICHARFYDKSKLARHIRTHSGLKPFACFACERKFNDKSYLKQHLKNSHNILEDPDGLKIFSME
ncbi:unnamed protein product [Phaedon cochleariae]|uniref:C2H2-type domain-containing protein n=1 Tax=Phaedon cochleariae TaxID=80249 RepID=A0A9N9SJC8_PHACE|nr:unnamed protein product [Phaedon cochleariae]